MKERMNSRERKIVESYESDEWRSLGKRTGRQYAAMARRQVKEKRINIRLGKDEKAIREALEMLK